MPAKIINGQEIADKILAELVKEVPNLKKRPGLAAILVGDNPSSIVYMRLKKSACEKTGINFHSYLLENNVKEDKILEVIEFLNNDPETTGILVQLPLPQGFNTDKIIHAIDPQKDIDGFHPKSKFISPNILGIIELIKSTGEILKNKELTVLSNSKTFAQPFKKILPEVKVNYLAPTDSKLEHKISHADILVVAIGQPHIIKPGMIKKDAILIDVGINKVKGKTVGDIDPACDKIAAFRSPVPGGVGPMTIGMLLQNLVKSIK